jgi:hypothetical protein
MSLVSVAIMLPPEHKHNFSYKYYPILKCLAIPFRSSPSKITFKVPDNGLAASRFNW